MTVHPSAKNLAADMVRRLAKHQPRTKRPKNPGESATRKLLATRSGGLCERCGIAPAQSVHHRWKRGQGGPWSASNCVALCGDGVRGCHGFAEHNPNAAEPEGLHLRPWITPADSRFLYRGRWVLLTDDGRVETIGGEA
ncbi:HNH endonuclease [Nocardia asiatica]|uniref:HNH endonuclease n=1 Tax=Nocardia asiatica TaxID=209252 RepID=UPI002458EA24|nr:HNH endonuclease [Nocardia asiatica]